MKNFYGLKRSIALAMVFFLSGHLYGQTNVFPSTGAAGIGTTAPSVNSLLDIQSTTKGVLFPRMTKAQRDAIVSPDKGLLIYQTNGTSGFYFYNGTMWLAVSPRGANFNLSNIYSTAISASLLPNATGTWDLGSSTFRWKAAYLDKLEVGSSPGSTYSITTTKDIIVNGQVVGHGGGSLYSNSVFGVGALNSNTTGANNIAIGYAALNSNSNGGGNTAIGYESMYSNQFGSYNTAVGYYTAPVSKTGFDNTYIGAISGASDTSANNNTGIGFSTLYQNVGNRNTALGANAMYNNTTGAGNVGVGYAALYNNGVAGGCVAIGDSSLLNNGSGATQYPFGSMNTSVGYSAMSTNTLGYYNTVVGSKASFSNLTGYCNSSFGYFAGYSNSTGQFNTNVGYYAYLPSTNLSNTTCIGSSSGFGSVSDRIEIGNTSVSYIGGQVNFSAFSDARVKSDVKENVPGLSFINKLRPVTYHFNIHRENEIVYKNKPQVAEWDSKYDIEKIQFTGFLAQEVEKAAESVDYNFSGVVKPNNENDLYSLRYSEFVVPMVKAIQELSAENETLKKENQQMKEDIAAIRTALKLSSTKTGDQVNDLSMKLSPNPTSGKLQIHLTGTVSSSTTLRITDLNGRLISSVSLTADNNDVDLSMLGNGNYIVQLVSGEVVLQSEKLMISK